MTDKVCITYVCSVGKYGCFVTAYFVYYEQCQTRVVQLVISYCCRNHINSFDVLIMDVSTDFCCLQVTSQRCSTGSGQNPSIIDQSCNFSAPHNVTFGTVIFTISTTIFTFDDVLLRQKSKYF